MTASVLAGLLGVALIAMIAAMAAAAETALTRIGRARAEAVDENVPGAADLLAVLADRESSLAPLLLLRVTGQVTVVVIIVRLAAGRASTTGVVVVTAAAVLSLYVVAEALPRIWALQHLDRAALVSARFLRLLLRLAPIRVLPKVLNGIANAILPGPGRAPVVSEDELIAMTEAAAADDAIDAEERDLIESVFALGDTVVREVMVPRTDMTTTNGEATITEVLDLAAQRGFSRVPVCGDSIDDIIGICLLKDLSQAERGGEGDRPINSLMRQPRFVPETKAADDLLREMQSAKYHLAIVVDEYGGTAGLVTLEDLVEELVGEIVDEYDNEEPLYQPLAGGNLLVHGRMPIDQLGALLDEEFIDGDWDTVGGFIFNTLGHVPEVGESIESGGVIFHVECMEGRRITRVRLVRVVS